MRILYTESSRNIGGQELRAVEEMEWFQKNGHDVLLAAAPDSGIHQAATERALKVAPITFRGSCNPLVITSLLAVCRRHRAQLIVTHSSRDTFAAWPVAGLLRLPLVRYQHICKPLKSSFWHRLAWRHAPRCIVAVSESIRRRLLDQKLAAASAIQVLGEFVDLQAFHPGVSPGDFRARHGIPAAAILLSQIGMIRPDKGQRILVQAAEHILKRHPHCWFLFAGSPTEPRFLDDLMQQIRASLTPSRIVLAGFQKNVAAVIAASNFICLTSLAEAQSKVIPQAFAMRKLVIASNTGGIPELVQHGDNGFLYERGNPVALAEAVDFAFRCDLPKLTGRAFEVARQMDIHTVMHRTEKLYASLLA